MWSSIIQLVVRIVNMVLNKKEKNETPEAIELRKKQEADRAIATGDDDSVNKQLDHGLRFPRKNSSNSK